MNIIRLKIFKAYPQAKITYGSTTTPKRKELALEKSHYNDAIAITGIDTIKSSTNTIFRIVQFRKKKRSLHEATAGKGIKSKNVTSKRNKKNTKQVENWNLNDCVKVFNKIGFISGFSGKSCYIKDIQGNYITAPNKKYKQVNLNSLELLCKNNNWQYQCVPDIL